MPTYRLPNPSGTGEVQATGNSLQEAQANAARAAGLASWTGGSYGANSLVAGTEPPPKPSGGINDDDMAKLRNFFGQTSGFSREELAEKKREFDAQMAYYEAQWQREGLPELQIKQKLADLEVERFRSTTGLDYLKFASTLGGPSDVFQQADFMRGAQARSDVPMFLQSLKGTLNMPAFTGAGAIAPDPQTAAGIAARLTGTSSTTTGGYNPDTVLSAIGDVFRRGVTGLAPNSLEQLNPSELGILQSGARKVGIDWNDWVKAYGASRVGQTALRPV